MNLRIFFFFSFIVALIGSCRKVELLEDSPPDTNISYSEINVSGNSRLQSVVTLHWSGTDRDGFVSYFEISFDKINWVSVGSRQDSTFRFSFSGTTDTADISFFVRAVDNKGAKDPSPAYLKIPIKNSPPSVSFTASQMVKDTAFTVLSLLWSASDPDGNQTIDSFYVRINNGSWYPIGKDVDFITLLPDNPGSAGSTTVSVYKNNNPVLLPIKISGMQLDQLNTIYIKAKDNSGTYSPIDSTNKLFIKKKNSDLLLIGANTGSPAPEAIYFPVISSVYGSYDYVSFETGNNKNIPYFGMPTFSFYLNLYDKVFIYTDETRFSGQTVNTSGKLILESASSALQEFLNKGGKLLVSAKFPSNLDKTSDVFQYLPMDSLSSSSGQARVPTDSMAVPDPVTATSYSPLVSAGFIIGADPFYVKSSSTVIFRGQLQKVSGWKGPNIIGAKTNNSAGKTNLVFISVDLNMLNKNQANFNNFFTQVLKNEFNW